MSDTKFTEYKAAVAELKDLISGYGADVSNLKDESAEFKTRFEKLNEALDSLELEVKRTAPRPAPEVVSAEHTALFKSALVEFARNKGGRAGIPAMFKDQIKTGYHAALAGNAPGEVKSDNLVRFDFASAGALLVPAPIQQEIIRDVVESTPVLGVARVTPTNAEAIKRRYRTSTPGGRWLEEEAKNEKGKPTYKMMRTPLHKWASLYGWTIEQEMDSAYDLVSELMLAFREDFAVDFGQAFISGDGVGKPTGMVGQVSEFPSGQLSINSDLLIQLQAQLKDNYQNGASWMFDRLTRANIRTQILAAGNDLNGAWEPDLTRRTPTLLLGAPIVNSRVGDLAGRIKGNFTTGQVPILYGDFRQGYEVAMGAQMYMIDDPYSEADSFVRSLHVMNRVGGDVTKKEAIFQLTMTSS